MKKIVGFVVVALATVFALTTTPEAVSADGAISAREQTVLDELNSQIVIGGKGFSVPAAEINAATNHLNNVDLTQAQVDSAIYNIQAAKALAAGVNVDASGANSLEEALALLPADISNQIKHHIIAAGNAVGVSISFGNGSYAASAIYGDGATNAGASSTGNTGSGVTVTDKKGSTVYSSGSPVKNTGANYAVSGIALTSLLIAAAGAVFVTRKNKLA